MHIVTTIIFFSKLHANIQGDSERKISVWEVIIIIIFNYALQPLRLIVRSGLDVPTFATRRLHACHHSTAPNGGR